jgi:hypothetical protein
MCKNQREHWTFLRPIPEANAFLDMLVYKRMPRGFYSEDRLICHRSVEGKFMQSSVNFGFCRRHFNFVRERTTCDLQILNVEMYPEYIGILAGDVTWIQLFQFGIVWVSTYDVSK